MASSAERAPEVNPPVLRYKSVNTKYKTQIAPESSALSNAMKRVPARVKALGGPILEDFLAIAAECDKQAERAALFDKELDESRRREEGLNTRLEEGRTNFDLLVTRFTNSVEQATQLRKQVDEERQDTSARHAAAVKQEKMLRDQVAALRRQIDGERMMATNYKKEIAALRDTLATLERELAEFKTNDTLSVAIDPKSRKEHHRKEEIKKLNAEVAGLREDLAKSMEARRELEATMEKERAAREGKDDNYQDLLRKFEATNRVLERSLEKLASANEFLDTADALGHDDALARVIAFNEEMTHVASLFSEKVSFLADGEDDLPNPYQSPDEEDLVHRFLSPRFPPLLLHQDAEKRRSFVELAIRACLVYYAGLILNGGCFGLREDMDQFLLQVWGIIQSDRTSFI
jgi:DNA repair exonuclease SbcCD ATPase subunit